MTLAKKKPIELSDHFTIGRLIRYAIPSILMMIFMSVYMAIDGLFVSNFAGKAQFTAVNLMWPAVMVLSSFGFMFGAGGSALIGKLFGQNKSGKANEVFTMTIVASLCLGVILGVISCALTPQIASLMGAEGEVYEYSIAYGRWLFATIPLSLLQFEFQNLFNASEKPLIGMVITIAAGCANIVLDGLFVGWFGWGLTGASVATVVSIAVAAIGPLIYFSLKNKSKLRFCKYKTDFRVLGRVCANGFSELLANVAMSVVSICYNRQLLRLLGEDGVAAYGVVTYLLLIFTAIFMGYAMAAAPITSYNLGAKNKEEMRSVLSKSLAIIGITSAVMVALAEGLAEPLSILFIGYDSELLELTVHAFRLSSFQFLFIGFAMFGSSYFTALNNGAVSGIIAFLRTAIFQVLFVYTMPLIWGADGIWVSLIGAEFVCSLLVFIFLFRFEKKYGYGFWKNLKRKSRP